MNATQYIWCTVCFAILATVVVLDLRMRIHERAQINAQLSKIPCPECGGRLTEWRGEMSHNFYTFVDESLVEDVIEVSCTQCGEHMDAFWSSNRELSVPRPWEELIENDSRET
jgi:hypothetical protein